MSIFTRSKIINIPRLGFYRNGEVDWEIVAGVAFGVLGFVIVATFLLAFTFHTVRWIVRKPGPPPKVITKVIHESALTAAQDAYIKQCEGNEDSSYNHAIPNVEDHPWTCTYAH